MPEDPEELDAGADDFEPLTEKQIKWLKSSPDSPFADLFAPPEPAPAAPAKGVVSGGGQKVPANQAADTMTELVSTLIKGVKAQAREEARSEPKAAPSAPAKPFEPPVKKSRFWGV